MDNSPLTLPCSSRNTVATASAPYGALAVWALRARSQVTPGSADDRALAAITLLSDLVSVSLREWLQDTSRRAHQVALDTSMLRGGLAALFACALSPCSADMRYDDELREAITWPLAILLAYVRDTPLDLVPFELAGCAHLSAHSLERAWQALMPFANEGARA